MSKVRPLAPPGSWAAGEASEDKGNRRSSKAEARVRICRRFGSVAGSCRDCREVQLFLRAPNLLAAWNEPEPAANRNVHAAPAPRGFISRARAVSAPDTRPP